MPTPAPILPIVDKILGIFQDWQKNRPMNKLRYRIEAAIEYVRLDEKSGEYKDYSDDKIKKYKEHYRKRIYDE